MLREYKDNRVHYFFDDQGLLQGEFKRWHDNGQLREHCFYVNDEKHGEYKEWFRDCRQLADHCFYVNDKRVIFDEIPYPATSEELMLFKLKYDLKLLPVETSC